MGFVKIFPENGILFKRKGFKETLILEKGKMEV